MKRSFATALVLVACGFAGCGDDGADTGPPAMLANLSEPIVGCTIDYDPASGPREIARNSQLLVRGRIGNPRRGIYPLRPNGSEGRAQTDLIPIKTESVTLLGSKGNRAALRKFVDDPVIWVEIDCAFAPPNRQEKFDALSGREALVYLNRRETGEPPGRLTYGPAGRPRPLFSEASPEGFLMELASGKGVRDLDTDQRYPGASLKQFLPNKARFPPRN